MRIAILTTSYPSYDGDPSGHFVRQAACRLAETGHLVHVIAPGARSIPIEVDAGVRVHRAFGASLFAWPGAVARAKARPLRLFETIPFAAHVARHLVAAGPFDRIIAHWIVPCGYPLGALAAVATGAELCVVAHGADVRLLLALPRALRSHVVETLLAQGAMVTFAAECLFQALVVSLPAGLATRLSHIARVEAPPIDASVDASYAARLRALAGVDSGEILAVCVGRLVPSKRVDLAIRGAACGGGRVRLVVVGDGPDRPRLEQLAREAKVPIHFAGLVARRDALGWIRAADVLIHPSAAEGAPTVVREARALGVQVLACPSGDVAAWALRDPGIRLVAPSAADIGQALLAELPSRAPRMCPCIS